MFRLCEQINALRLLAQSHTSVLIHKQGSRLLSNVMVASAIKAHAAVIAASLEITAERVITAIASIAFSDTRRLFEGTRLKRPDEWDDATANAVASLEPSSVGNSEGSEQVAKVRFADRLKALDMLARHLSLYHDKLVVNVTDGLPQDSSQTLRSPVR